MPQAPVHAFRRNTGPASVVSRVFKSIDANKVVGSVEIEHDGKTISGRARRSSSPPTNRVAVGRFDRSGD